MIEYFFSINFCSGFIQVRQNLMAASSNTIDLTEEDEARPQRSPQNNPPALVALNMRGRTQVIQTQQTVQRHVVTTQQPLRAQAFAQPRKLPAIGKRRNRLQFAQSLLNWFYFIFI